MSGEGRSEKGRSGSSSDEDFLNRLIKSLPQLTEQARGDFDRLRDPNHERKKKELEIGWFGRLIGDSEHAPNNIVAMIIIICAVALLPLVFSIAFRDNTSSIASGLAITLLTTMTTSGGYLFGRSSRPASRRNGPRSTGVRVAKGS